MQERGFLSNKKAAALCIVLIMLAQQVCAGPLVSQVQSSSDLGADEKGDHGVQTLRRIARMTPLWRVMNSKPVGAYCQNNYECSTGLCSAGHCSSLSSQTDPVNY